MKKLTLALAFVLASIPAYAQQWDQVNGSMQVKSGPTAPLVIIDQTAAGQKILSLRNNGTEKCYVDVSGNLNCAGTFTLTGQFLAGDGSASAPSYSFASETGAGLFRNGAADIRLMTAGGNVSFRTAANQLIVGVGGLVFDNGTQDVSLSRGAADRLDLATGDSFKIVSGGLGVGATETTSGVVRAQSSIVSNTGNISVSGTGAQIQAFGSGASFAFASTPFAINTAPTVTSAGTSPSITASNGTAAFRVNVGTGGVATTIVLAMPAATTGWNCQGTNITATAANRAAVQTVFQGSTTTSATLQNQNVSTGVAVAYTASDIVAVTCMAF